MDELDFLKRNRSRLNQMFQLRWLENRTLDGDAFLQQFQHFAGLYLQAPESSEAGGKLLSPSKGQGHSESRSQGQSRSKSKGNGGSAARHDSENLDRVLLSIYGTLLRLQGNRIWSDNEQAKAVLASALQDFSQVMTARPEDFLPRVLNACFYLQRHSVDPHRWWTLCSRLGAIEEHYVPDRERFFRILSSLSWPAGMSHFRLSALEVLHDLNQEEVSLLFPRINNIESFRKWILDMKSNPWAGLQSTEPIVLGGFAGFGKSFRLPPRLLGFDARGALHVTDGVDRYLVFVDRFGSQVIQNRQAIRDLNSSEEPDTSRLEMSVSAGLKDDLKRAGVAVPAQFSQTLHFAHTRFLVSEDSHYLWAVPEA